VCDAIHSYNKNVGTRNGNIPYKKSLPESACKLIAKIILSTKRRHPKDIAHPGNDAG